MRITKKRDKNEKLREKNERGKIRNLGVEMTRDIKI